jgi:hypothetical protein
MRTTTRAICLAICLTALAAQHPSSAAQTSLFVTVAAGSSDRRDAIVTFALPKKPGATSYGLRDDAGQVTPLQIDADGNAAFVLAQLPAGATKTYRLVAMKPAAPAVESIREGTRITIKDAGRQLLGYTGEPGELPGRDIEPIFKRGGYIHPVYTPAGRAVTDDFPPDHRHHHGIWFAWTKTEFEGRHPDFWNMGDGTGRVEFVALDQTWSGPVHAGFKARHRYVDLSAPMPKTVLNEVWEVRAYRALAGQRPYTVFDLVATQACATASPLTLPEYRYGGIGFRGHREWIDKGNCAFLTSEGKDRGNGNGTRARWCHTGGRIGGALAGVAVLDHPGNFRAPQPTRLNPDQPFFCYAPSVMGQWQIAPGKPYVSRYRFVVYDGPPDGAELDRLWNDYANPPQVKVTSK